MLPNWAFKNVTAAHTADCQRCHLPEKSDITHTAKLFRNAHEHKTHKEIKASTQKNKRIVNIYMKKHTSR